MYCSLDRKYGMVAYLTLEILRNQVLSGVRTCVSHHLELLSLLRRYCSAAATLHHLHCKWRAIPVASVSVDHSDLTLPVQIL